MNKRTITDFIAGSEEAFAEIYKAYIHRARTFGLKFFHDKEKAKDFAQDLLLLVWNQRERFKDVVNFDSYLWGMAWKLASTKHKKNINRERLINEYLEGYNPHHNNVESYLRENENDQVVQQFLSTLPDRSQKIYALIKVCGYSHDDVAKRMALSKPTISNIMTHILKSLRNYLGDHASPVVLWLLSFLL
jgi:RNA polymerase sigma factor (sigma-70 family)